VIQRENPLVSVSFTKFTLTNCRKICKRSGKFRFLIKAPKKPKIPENPYDISYDYSGKFRFLTKAPKKPKIPENCFIQTQKVFQ